MAHARNPTGMLHWLIFIQSSSIACSEDVISASCLAGICAEDDSSLSLLQVAARITKTAGKHGAAAQGPESSGWFGGFSQDESTFSMDGVNAFKSDPTWAVEYGKDPSVGSPFPITEPLGPAFFHESRSGGPRAAWQTEFPAPNPNLAGMDGRAENPWRYTPSGWVQEYNPDPNPRYSETEPPIWFDNSINQIDGYGRPMQPPVYSGARYEDGWEQRSVNTTISCKQSGCVGRSSLQLFDLSVEEAKMCKISIDVHATDYADPSREFVEYWKINGYIATLQCSPGLKGCGKSSSNSSINSSMALAALYPCVNSLPVVDLVNSSGTVVVEGKISKAVDDCATSNGDLLSAVASGTCLIRSRGGAA